MADERSPHTLSPALAHLWTTARAVHAHAPDAIVFIGDVATLAMALHAGDPVPLGLASDRAAAYISVEEMGFVRDYEVVRPDHLGALQRLERDGVVIDLYVERRQHLPLRLPRLSGRVRDRSYEATCNCAS